MGLTTPHLLPQAPSNQPTDSQQIFCSFDLPDPSKNVVAQFIIPICKHCLYHLSILMVKAYKKRNDYATTKSSHRQKSPDIRHPNLIILHTKDGEL